MTNFLCVPAVRTVLVATFVESQMIIPTLVWRTLIMCATHSWLFSSQWPLKDGVISWVRCRSPSHTISMCTSYPLSSLEPSSYWTSHSLSSTLNSRKLITSMSARNLRSYKRQPTWTMMTSLTRPCRARTRCQSLSSSLPESMLKRWLSSFECASR